MKRQGLLIAALLMLLILILGVGFGYLILFYFPPSTQLNQLITRVMVLIIISITTGLVCRFGISQEHIFAKILYAFTGSIVSVLILDRFMPTTFDLLDADYTIKTLQIGDWTQLACLIILTLVITLVGTKKKAKAAPSRTRKKNVTLSDRIKTIGRSISVFFSDMKSSVAKSFTKKKPAKKTSKTRKKAQSSSRKTTPAKSTKKPQTKAVRKTPSSTVKISGKKTTVKVAKKKPAASKRRKKANNHVTLVGVEDHHCPYCLEEVKKKDRRGVVVCPDCGTWHHKDCWDVTGSCQIAHKHEL